MDEVWLGGTRCSVCCIGEKHCLNKIEIIYFLYLDFLVLVQVQIKVMFASVCNTGREVSQRLRAVAVYQLLYCYIIIKN